MDDLRIDALRSECRRHEEMINRLSDQIYDLKRKRLSDKYDAECRRDTTVYCVLMVGWFILTLLVLRYLMS